MWHQQEHDEDSVLVDQYDILLSFSFGGHKNNAEFTFATQPIKENECLLV